MQSTITIPTGTPKDIALNTVHAISLATHLQHLSLSFEQW